ncbi:MAG: aminodeoxychorismate/anthranilate synthase component II [Flammeovirgaceae bacterium]|nr:MAG: aminodeoxychorismate/anthranilate synthase component II [Flammeovirgaceae bacterium]
MKILILDNYDSFTYNLVHIVKELGYTCEVFRNDAIAPEQVSVYDKILLSPGPGIPDEAGILKEVVRMYASSKSILGICLGHQAIAEVFGGTLYNIPRPLHGVTSIATVLQPDEYLFQRIEPRFQVCHYHSWAVNPENLPTCLEAIAGNEEGLIMGIRHTAYDVRGLQFHPESIMTPAGPAIIKNWLTQRV